MKRFWAGKQIVTPLLLVALMLAAGESFAAGELQIDLAVKVRKSPRTKTCSYEYKDDQKLSRTTDQGKEFGGETDKDIYVTSDSYTLEITLSNRARQGGDCRLEWYFIAEKMWGDSGSYKKALEVVDRGGENITLGAGAVAEETATHDFALKESLTTGTYEIEKDPETGKYPDWAPSDGIDTWDYESRNGERYVGYVVLITANGQIIAKDSNSSIFLKDKWIETCRTPPKWKAPQKKTEWEDLYKKWW